jgi:hypothetical protein
LKLASSSIDKYGILIESYLSPSEVLEVAEPYKRLVIGECRDVSKILFEILVLLQKSGIYAGSSRVCFKGLCKLLSVRHGDFAALEYNLAIFNNRKVEKLNGPDSSNSTTTESFTSASILKYATVGAVSIGVGAAAAVAGTSRT